MTEDDEHGGLDAVLAAALEKYGLPPKAGLTGLLRHLELSRDFTDGINQMTIRSLRSKLDTAEHE